MIDEDDFWSNWWNEIWQGKPKYSEKTYPSATLSTTKSLMYQYISGINKNKLRNVTFMKELCKEHIH
jgi:hypothetical protein